MIEESVYHGVKFIKCGYNTQRYMPLEQIWNCKIRHTITTLEGKKQKEDLIDIHELETGEAGYSILSHNTFEKAFFLKNNIRCNLYRTEEGNPIYRLICVDEK